MLDEFGQHPLQVLPTEDQLASSGYCLYVVHAFS
jgi:hypothetical protein